MVERGNNMNYNCYKSVPVFRFWCQKVLPLVYDESLSYYELLCKVVDYINNLIKTDNNIIEDIDKLRSDLNKVQEWINNFETSYVEEIIKQAIATMIFVEINNDGYIVYNVPENWKDIEFNTTGLDIELALQPEYGHLVLSY